MFDYILLILIIFIFIVFSWRLYSNRHILPCPAWLGWMVELDNPFAKAHKASEIINLLTLKENIRILDIGCGPGRVSIPLAVKISSINGQVTALDLQEKMLDKVKRKSNSLGLSNIVTVNNNIKNISSTSKYDVILMICMLGEVPVRNHTAVLNSLKNQLTATGIISITETIFDPHYQSHKKISKLMYECGYYQVKYTGNFAAYTCHFAKK